MKTLFGPGYPDTFEGGQKLRNDVDNGYCILHTKEPEGYSTEFLQGWRMPKVDKNNLMIDFRVRRHKEFTYKERVSQGIENTV